MPPVQHRWTARKGDAHHFARVLALQTILSTTILLYAVMPVAAAAAGIVMGKIYLVLIGVITLLTVLAMVYGMAYFVLHAKMGDGAMWVSGLNEHGLTVGPTGEPTFWPYSNIAAVIPRGDAVVLKTRNTKQKKVLSVLPSALLPPEAIDYIRAHQR
ncbi:hypothetical protein BST20_17370 [Mycobacterium branderi]|uniref:PH domain-containing protein n=1 Tax=Mycobacterium branderi TaxID=43348 RepID=A0AA91LVA2_9MYCO|nr:hypothetical protein BST20_17370 [Mycobacterium branderi]